MGCGSSSPVRRVSEVAYGGDVVGQIELLMNEAKYMAKVDLMNEVPSGSGLLGKVDLMGDFLTGEGETRGMGLEILGDDVLQGTLRSPTAGSVPLRDG